MGRKLKANSTVQIKTINKDIFKAYDIRGKVGKDWCINENYNDAFLIGQALGSQLLEAKSKTIIVGRDGRNSSESISQNLILGLLSVGCDVTDIGLVATPVVYFCLDQLQIPNCAMVTGSHNPPDHNGIKLVTNRIATSQQMIESLYFDIISKDFFSKNLGEFTRHDSAITHYQKAISADINIQKQLRVGIDSSNGATALFSESLFTEIGCEIHPLFCEVDGNFPNHSPDPTTPENLESLISLVKENNLDLGIAFDGDGDRMIAVDNEGNILWPDRILILLAQQVLNLNPNSPIVMRDRWNDFDDAPYVAARFLEILSNTDKSCCEVFKDIPDSFSTHEYKIKSVDMHEAQRLVSTFIANAHFAGANLNLLDGLRVEYDDCWGLIRSSNTSASIGLRFEATNAKRLEEIKQAFRDVFKKIDPELQLPF